MTCSISLRRCASGSDSRSAPLYRSGQRRCLKIDLSMLNIDPLLQARLAGEHRQTARIAGGLARRTFVLPWLPESPVGVQAQGALAAWAWPQTAPCHP